MNPIYLLTSHYFLSYSVNNFSHPLDRYSVGTGDISVNTLLGINNFNLFGPMKNKKGKKALQAEKRELAMIEGILEGSPDGIGVVVVRLDCGCRKMAAISKEGEPASKIIMYRDMAESICTVCKEDNGSFVRVTESFIHWVEPAPSETRQQEIYIKVLGSNTAN
ncbi:MAG: hypothetical protein V2B20_15900 [Pseudomonadota bacterium]